MTGVLIAENTTAILTNLMMSYNKENVNNNNKRVPDLANKENEFWTQAEEEEFYIPQPDSNLVPSLPFVDNELDDGLHDLPVDDEWLFGDSCKFMLYDKLYGVAAAS